MNTYLVFSLLLAVVFGQTNFDSLVKNEVDAIVAANPNINVGECFSKCDAMFDLINNHDEHTTDALCQVSCECKINNNCNHNNQHTTIHHNNHHTTPHGNNHHQG